MGQQPLDILVTLIGEQPMANLLPIRYLSPARVLLLFSRRTQPVSDKLRRVLSRWRTSSHEPQIEVFEEEVQPYDIASARQAILGALERYGWEPSRTVFNLTGGTKPMMLAAYDVAHSRRVRTAYLQSEHSRSLLYHYSFDDGSEGLAVDRVAEIPGIITLKDYLDVHLGVDGYACGQFAKGPGKAFELAVFAALRDVVDEACAGIRIGGVVDIDLAVRCGNQVGIAEIKTGRDARRKRGIDQLGTAAHPTFLGRYTATFLIIDRYHTGTNLPELASERGITVIELPSFSIGGTISEEDRSKLREIVCGSLEGRLHRPASTCLGTKSRASTPTGAGM